MFSRCAVPERVESGEYRPLPPISSGKDKKIAEGGPVEGPRVECISPSASSGTVTFRPNNYRRRIVCHDIPKDLGGGHLGVTPFISYGKGNGHRFIKGLYPRVTVQIGKRTITAIYDQHDEKGIKEEFEVPRVGGVGEKSREIIRMLDGVLSDVVRRIGAVGEGEPITSWYEDGIKGERFIDGLPRDLIIQGRPVTKLYGEGVEFKGAEEPAVYAERYLRNAALLELAPEIAVAIRELGDRLAPVDALERVKEGIRIFPDDVVSAEGRARIGSLSSREKELLSEWTFERFGGVRG